MKTQAGIEFSCELPRIISNVWKLRDLDSKTQLVAVFAVLTC
jgi:hypothetical protein